MRLTALLDDGHLVQQMESPDNPVMQLMALYIVPNLQFEVAFLPQLAASFVPGRKASHLPRSKGYVLLLPI